MTNRKQPGPGDLFTIEGHLTAEGIALFCETMLKGESVQIPEECREHLEECVECKMKIENLLDFLRQDDVSPEEQVPDVRARFSQAGIRRLWQSGGFRIAAAFAGLVAVSVLLYFTFKPNASDRTGTIASGPADTTRQTDLENKSVQETVPVNDEPARTVSDRTEHKVLLAASFKPVPALEAYVSDNLRNGAIEVTEPENNVVYNGTLTFKWKPVEEKLTFSVRNNLNKTVFETSVETNEFLLSSSFSTGLYYWILENDSEILYVGKFKVTD